MLLKVCLPKWQTTYSLAKKKKKINKRVLAISETTAVNSESINKFPSVSNMTRTDSYELLISPDLYVY